MAASVRAAAARVGRVIAMGMGSIGAAARRKPAGASPLRFDIRRQSRLLLYYYYVVLQ